MTHPRPKPTLPKPSQPIGGGMPLWLGLLLIALVASPLVVLIVSGAHW